MLFRSTKVAKSLNICASFKIFSVSSSYFAIGKQRRFIDLYSRPKVWVSLNPDTLCANCSFKIADLETSYDLNFQLKFKG